MLHVKYRFLKEEDAVLRGLQIHLLQQQLGQENTVFEINAAGVNRGNRAGDI